MECVEVNSRIKMLATFEPGVDIGRAVRPVKMMYQGREIEFTELGLYHPTVQGKRMVHVFDMSDGASDYRLEFDAERLSWTLIAITVVNDG